MKKNNKLIGFLITSAVINIVLVILLVVVVVGGILPLNFLAGNNTIASSSGLPQDFSLLTEAYNILTQNYLKASDINSRKLSQGSVKGMVEALEDPYTVYVNPESFKLETSDFSGKWEGIGAVLGYKDKLLTVISPIALSPAEEAGIKAGDVIMKIDDIDASKFNLNEAVLKIRGPAGTTVKLSVYREGEKELLEKTLIRRQFQFNTFYSEIKDNILYVRIFQFVQTTPNDLIKSLKDAKEKKISGIVLDLRDNGGGLLNESIDVASQFLSSGTVVDIVDRNGNHEKIPVRPGGIATDKPMVVLVNEGSASASEVLCGPLQDYGRAKLIGKKTFGKGIVQTVMRMSDGSALHITTMSFYTPLGKQIHGVGLTPDIPSDLKDDDLKDWAINYMKQQK
jgi:carboxyl-terminal processing protease